MGAFPTIVAHSYAATKESMNNPNFDGKPQLELVLLREPEFKQLGISLLFLIMN